MKPEALAAVLERGDQAAKTLGTLAQPLDGLRDLTLDRIHATCLANTLTPEQAYTFCWQLFATWKQKEDLAHLVKQGREARDRLRTG